MSDKVPVEEEYFARLDKEQSAKMREILAIEKAKSAREERQKLHYMRCGKCGGEMNTHAFRGVDVDICGECGAVLLDPGELQTLAGEDQSGVLDGIKQLFRFKGRSA